LQRVFQNPILCVLANCWLPLLAARFLGPSRLGGTCALQQHEVGFMERLQGGKLKKATKKITY